MDVWAGLRTFSWRPAATYARMLWSNPLDNGDVDAAGALAHGFRFGVLGRLGIGECISVAREFDHDVALGAVALHDLACAATHDRRAAILVERHL